MSPSFSWLIADARLALRSLQRNPGSALLALISIALGIGLATALFSAVDAFVLRPFPFRAPGELWTISSRGADQRTIGYGWADVEDMRRASENFGTLVAYQRVGRFLAQGDASSFGLVHIVDAHFFSTLGVRAQLGHADVTPGADGTPRIVLGHRRWQRQFGGDPAIIGQTITVNHHPHLVAGVMPREFEGVMRNVPCDAWIDAATWISQRNERTRRSRNDQFEMFIRLAPGVSPASAAARLDAAIRGPDAHQPVPAGQPGTTLERNFTPSWQKRLLVSGGLIPIALLLLLVTCANAAQLRLMELEQRRREFAVRIALGSNPLRLAGGVLVETLLLGLVATVAGLLLAQALIVATEAAVAQYSDYMVPGMRLDWRAAVFCGFAMLGALLLAGLAPTRQALRLDVNNELKTGSGTGIGIGRFRRVLIAGQAAASVVFCGLALTFADSFRRVAMLWPGFDTQLQAVVFMAVPGGNDAHNWAQRAGEHLRTTVPEVKDVTFARRLPLTASGGGLRVRVEIPDGAPLAAGANMVAGNYFSLLGLRMLTGRGIEPGDTAQAGRVVVINRALAERALPGKDPVGEWLTIEGEPRRVVGVAENAPTGELHATAIPEVIFPHAQYAAGDLMLVVATAGPAEQLLSAVPRALRQFDARSETIGVTTLRDHFERALLTDRITTQGTLALGALGIVLTGAGLFGLQQQAVRRRRREIGVRMALGAEPGRVRRMVLIESLRLVAPGIVLGLLALPGGIWLARSLLYGVDWVEPLTLAGSLAVLFGMVLVASWIPARAATRVEPAVVLRSE